MCNLNQFLSLTAVLGSLDFIVPDPPFFHSYNTILQGINEEQSLLSWEMTKFPLLQSMISLKEPYDQLWHTTYDFHQKYERWYNGKCHHALY